MKMKKTWSCCLFVVALFLMAETASACSVCFGGPGDQTTEAMGSAILLLLVIIVGILASLLGFMFHLIKRARAHGPLTLEAYNASR